MPGYEQRSRMVPVNHGFIVTRIWFPGGPIRIMSALKGFGRLPQRHGCRHRSRSCLPSWAVRQSIWAAISQMSFMIRSPISQPFRTFHRANGMTSYNADFLKRITPTGQKTANNPTSPVYGGRMIDTALIMPWAWDARPFQWFPVDPGHLE